MHSKGSGLRLYLSRFYQFMLMGMDWLRVVFWGPLGKPIFGVFSGCVCVQKKRLYVSVGGFWGVIKAPKIQGFLPSCASVEGGPLPFKTV